MSPERDAVTDVDDADDPLLDPEGGEWEFAFDADDAGGTRIEGIYGPNANVWSLFLYGYLIIGSVGLFGGCIGFAQQALGRSCWGLWIFWVSLGLGLALWILAQFGQKIGAHQTYRLHHVYEDAMGRTEELH